MKDGLDAQSEPGQLRLSRDIQHAVVGWDRTVHPLTTRRHAIVQVVWHSVVVLGVVLEAGPQLGPAFD